MVYRGPLEVVPLVMVEEVVHYVVLEEQTEAGDREEEPKS